MRVPVVGVRVVRVRVVQWLVRVPVGVRVRAVPGSVVSMRVALGKRKPVCVGAVPALVSATVA